MREIKFRAWETNAKRMFSYEELRTATDGMVQAANEKLKRFALPETPSGLFLPLDDPNMIFMQYTGLKDKNGKEIYEGDIVYNEVFKDTVEYLDNLAGYYLFTAELKHFYSDECEVVGNIYEDKETSKK